MQYLKIMLNVKKSPARRQGSMIFFMLQKLHIHAAVNLNNLTCYIA